MLLSGVSGVPGSGKSTLAVPLTERVNHLLASSSPTDKGKERETAVCVGMDGWHLTRAELDAFEVSCGCWDLSSVLELEPTSFPSLLSFRTLLKPAAVE